MPHGNANLTHHPPPAEIDDPYPSDLVDAERCQSLARALLKQAFLDAFSATSERADRRHARAFLTATTGDWAIVRAFWSELADVDANQLRASALQAIDEGTDWAQMKNAAMR